MPRENLERELQKLQDEVLLLGSMAEQAVLDAVTALRQMDRKVTRSNTIPWLPLPPSSQWPVIYVFWLLSWK
jgi:hypothetical protein